MLVEVDVSSVRPDALHKGLNRLYVQVKERRAEYISELYMGELEIITEK